MKSVRWVLRGVVVVVLLVVAMSTAVSGASAAGWLAPVDVPMSVSDLGFDADGNAIAVGVGADGGGTSTFRSMIRPPGGQWSALGPVSGAGDSNVTAPHVAVDPHGNAVAIWSADNQDSDQPIVRVSSRSAGGAWSDPVKISDGAIFDRGQEVAIDAQGNATASWTEFPGGGGDPVVRAAYRPSGGAWTEPVVLSEGTIGSNPQLAVDPQGKVTAVWLGTAEHVNGPPGVVTVVRSASRPAGGDWSETVALSSEAGSASALGPQVAVDAQGNATAVWELFDNGYSVQTAHRSAGGTWSDADDLAAGQSPRLAVDPQGSATAVWQSTTPSGTVVRSSTSPGDGSWSGPVDIATGTDPNKVGFPWVAVDPKGNVTAIWARYDTTSLLLAQATHRTPGGGWSPVADLSVGRPITALPAAGVDPQGHTSLVWSSSENPWEGSSSVFDPIGPELRNVNVPGYATAGQPAAMSVDPFDTWSGVTTTWDFGDGQSASGAAVTHTYSLANVATHSVLITAIDALGNMTQTLRPLSVTVDPVPTPPGPGPAPRPRPALKAPVLSGLQQASARWRTHSVRRGPKLPVGTSFRFKLDRGAQVRLAFSHIVSGRRSGGRCVKPTKANRRKARCDRAQAVGTLSVAGKSGSNSLAFRGMIRGRTLPSGRYRVVVTARADGKTSTAKSLSFTIVR